MISIDCISDKLIFSSPDSSKAVMKAFVEKTKESFTMVGDIAAIRPGQTLSIRGDWTVSARHGRQFSVEDWTEKSPDSLEAIKRYLGSGMFRGIGPYTAGRIVARFGEKALEIIDNTPERLVKERLLTQKKLEAFKEKWQQLRAERNSLIFLRGLGLSATKASKVLKAMPSDLEKQIKSSPYSILEVAEGISFREADAIAMNLGLASNDSRRIAAAIIFMLKQASEEGHTFLHRSSLLAYVTSLIGCSKEETEAEIANMLAAKTIFAIEDGIYTPMMYYCETGVARRLKQIFDTPSAASTSNSAKKVPEDNIEYDEYQLEAISTALSSKITIITGGPGTGKTTVTRGLISRFSSAGRRILLAAPTGRAAKRMEEATGLEARTIHRLLEYSPVDGFVKNEDNKLKGDVLIVDECSMLDIILFYSLLKAVPNTMSLVMVGDVDQLPSVGPGRVLRDIIESEAFPVVRLTRIFRQAQKSRIVRNAHAVNGGRIPDCSNGADADFFFINKSEPNDIAATITNLVQTRLTKAYGIAPTDIQVLTAVQKGEIGTIALNRLIQGAVNPVGISLSNAGTTFRIQDRVMQTKNNYDKNVFNGDIGTITYIDVKKKQLKVRFEDRNVQYSQEEMIELLPAYAITVHKSQGSEFPVVVMPLSRTHAYMLRRNLLYTAITRARKLCVIVGERDALPEVVSNVSIYSRNSNLRKLLTNTELQTETK